MDNGDGTYTAQFTGNVGSYYTGSVTGVVVDSVALDTADIGLEFFPVNDSRIDFDSGSAGDQGWNMGGSDPRIGYIATDRLNGIGNGTDTRPNTAGNMIVSNTNIKAIRCNILTNGYIYGISIYYADGSVSKLGNTSSGVVSGYAPSQPRSYRVGYVKGNDANGGQVTRVEFDLY